MTCPLLASRILAMASGVWVVPLRIRLILAPSSGDRFVPRCAAAIFARVSMEQFRDMALILALVSGDTTRCLLAGPMVAHVSLGRLALAARILARVASECFVPSGLPATGAELKPAWAKSVFSWSIQYCSRVRRSVLSATCSSTENEKAPGAPSLAHLQAGAMVGAAFEFMRMLMPTARDIDGRANVKPAGSDMLDRVYALDFHIGMIS